jgi:hypothetical protein
MPVRIRRDHVRTAWKLYGRDIAGPAAAPPPWACSAQHAARVGDGFPHGCSLRLTRDDYESGCACFPPVLIRLPSSRPTTHHHPQDRTPSAGQIQGENSLYGTQKTQPSLHITGKVFFAHYTIHRRHSQRTHTHPYGFKIYKVTTGKVCSPYLTSKILLPPFLSTAVSFAIKYGLKRHFCPSTHRNCHTTPSCHIFNIFDTYVKCSL